MLLITFHGSTGGITNVQAYADSGSNAGECVQPEVLHGDWPGAGDDKHVELRGLALDGSGNLWVANGAGGSKGSTLMVFNPSNHNQYEFDDTFVDNETTPAFNHPFGFTFDGDGNCYVSNQDSNVVACFNVAGAPNPLPPALQSYSQQPGFNAGTFVASTQGGLDGTPATTPVPAPLGLQFAPATGKLSNSVRDVLYYEPWNVLFVCDEVALQVKLYDLSTGNYLVSIATGTTSPTHLTIQSSVLYIASGAQVFTYDLSSANPPSSDASATPIETIELKAAAGITFDGDGTMYVADRTANTIYRCVYSDGAWKQQTLVSGLKDNPEFILHVHA